MGRIVLGARKRDLISELNIAALSGQPARNPGRHSITPLLAGENIIAYILCTLLKVPQEPPQCRPVLASPHADIPPPLKSRRAPEHFRGQRNGAPWEIVSLRNPCLCSVTPETISSSITAPLSWHGPQQALPLILPALWSPWRPWRHINGMQSQHQPS